MSQPPAPSSAFQFVDGACADVLLICDHASNRIPAELAELGLEAEQRDRHIAWDPGAAAVTLALAERMQWPAFLGAWSRLVVDLNRDPEAQDLIVAEADGVTVPGNAGLDANEVARRIDCFHRPYHSTIDDYLARLEAAGRRPRLIAIHSFTPVLGGQPRPWQAGLVWQRREPWLERLLASLAEQAAPIGDNQPYDGAAMGHTLDRLGVRDGRPHVMFEIRQDLLTTPEQQQLWADRLLRGLQHSGFLDANAALGRKGR
jgi:predicted N-formylglutamate amidohydrolase